MKSIVLIIAIALCAASTVIGQRRIADSLIQKLETATPGYDQIDYCLGIARAYGVIGGHFPQMKVYTDKAWELSEIHDDLAGKAQTKGFYAMYYRSFGQVDEAMQAASDGYEYALASDDMDALTFAVYQYAELLVILKQQNQIAYDLMSNHLDKIDHTVTLKNQSNFYKTYAELISKYTGDYEQTIAYYELALDLIDQRIKNPDKQIRLGRVSAMYADGGVTNKLIAKHNLARTLSQFGQVDDAIALMKENINLAQSINNEDFEAWHTKTLANFLKIKGKYKEALENYQIASEIWSKQMPATRRDLVITNNDRAEVYYEMGDYDQAMSAYDEALRFVKEMNDTTAFHIVQLGVIKTRIKNGEAQGAAATARSLEQAAADYGDEKNAVNFKYLRAVAQQTLGNAELAYQIYDEVYDQYGQLGMSSQFPDILLQKAKSLQSMGNLSEAERTLTRSISLATENGQTNHVSKAYAFLSELQAEQGDFESALSSFKKYNQNENDLLTDNAQKILRREQVRQNVDQLQKEKDAVAERAKLFQARNRLYIGLALALLGFLLVGGYLFYQIRKSREIIQRRNEQLAELNATKDKFFSIIAHDIRSPLVALEGVEEQIEYYLKKNKTEKLQKVSAKVGATARRLGSLLDNLLNWALLQRGLKSYKPQQIGLAKIVEEVLVLFDIQSETKDLTLVNNIAQDIMVVADEASLNTIVRNLVSNAIKFTPSGGQIEISAEALHHTVHLSVKDSGIGMTEETVQQLFNLKPTSELGTAGEKGTGLGLILCKELIEQNKGNISVKSNSDIGTIFTITLPNVA